MNQVGLLVTFQARPGKEIEVENFLKSALPLVEAEAGTTTWFAFKVTFRFNPRNALPGRHISRHTNHRTCAFSDVVPGESCCDAVRLKGKIALPS